MLGKKYCFFGCRNTIKTPEYLSFVWEAARNLIWGCQLIRINTFNNFWNILAKEETSRWFDKNIVFKMNVKGSKTIFYLFIPTKKKEKLWTLPRKALIACNKQCAAFCGSTYSLSIYDFKPDS